MEVVVVVQVTCHQLLVPVALRTSLQITFPMAHLRILLRVTKSSPLTRPLIVTRRLLTLTLTPMDLSTARINNPSIICHRHFLLLRLSRLRQRQVDQLHLKAMPLFNQTTISHFQCQVIHSLYQFNRRSSHHTHFQFQQLKSIHLQVIC